MTSSSLILVVAVTASILLLGVETGNVITRIETENTDVIAVAGNKVETTIGIGSGTEIGTLEVVVVVVAAAAAAVVLTEKGSDFASAGRLTELKVTIRASPIRRCITSAGVAGGRRPQSRGTVIAGGRTTEVGIVSMSPGQAETTSGGREVRDTKEGTHDDVVSLL